MAKKKNKNSLNTEIELHKKYWKPNKISWDIASVVILIVAYLENKFVPSMGIVDGKDYHYFLLIYGIYLTLGYLAGFRFPRIGAYVGHFAPLNCLIGIVLIVTDLITAKYSLFAPPFFVSFAQIINQMVSDHHLLLLSTLSSLGLWTVSFIVGALVGIAIGLFIGRYRNFNYWTFPFLKVIGIIPAAAWMPITMVIFPSSYMAEVFLIVLAVWFPVAFMTAGGVQSIPKEYFESAKTLGFSEARIMRKVVIPGALPNIFVGFFTAMGLSFTMLVISEMIGAKFGLGWYINWAKGVGNYTQVYAAIVIMAVLFSIIFALLTSVERRILIWNEN